MPFYEAAKKADSELGRRKKKYTRIPLVTKLKIINCYKTGEYSYLDIARKFKIGYPSARYIYHKYNEEFYFPPVQRGKGKPGKECKLFPHLDEIQFMYNVLGLTFRQIGKTYGVSYQRVEQVFRKYGIKSRRGAVRKFTHCNKGHQLNIENKEYRGSCAQCRQERLAFRAAGKHLKTHCINGHEYTLKSTRFVKYAPGKYVRRCKICQREHMKKYREKNK